MAETLTQEQRLTLLRELCARGLVTFLMYS